MSLVPFPADFPADALPVLAGYLRKTTPIDQAANAAWNVLGWGGHFVKSGTPLPQMAPGAPQLSDAEIADKLDEFHAQLKATPSGTQAALFGGGAIWSLVGPLLIQVAKRLIDQWLGGGAATPGTP